MKSHWVHPNSLIRVSINLHLQCHLSISRSPCTALPIPLQYHSPLQYTCAVESALATCTSCHTVALATTVHLSLSIEDLYSMQSAHNLLQNGSKTLQVALQALQQCPIIAGVRRCHFPCAIVGMPAIVIGRLSRCLLHHAAPNRGGGGGVSLVAVCLSVPPMDTRPCLHHQAPSWPQSHSARQAWRLVACPFFPP